MHTPQSVSPSFDIVFTNLKWLYQHICIQQAHRQSRGTFFTHLPYDVCKTYHHIYCLCLLFSALPAAHTFPVHFTVSFPNPAPLQTSPPLTQGPFLRMLLFVWCHHALHTTSMTNIMDIAATAASFLLSYVVRLLHMLTWMSWPPIVFLLFSDADNESSSSSSDSGQLDDEAAAAAVAAVSSLPGSSMGFKV